MKVSQFQKNGSKLLEQMLRSVTMWIVTAAYLLIEILEQHQADANQEDNDDDDDRQQEALLILTLTAALEAVDTARRYFCIFNVDENVINQLSKIDTVICKLGKKT
ncbi:hypothetical protein T02_4340 [Trichinella nativa]|uniref:Uncharacterized protein n=1 Tax=Trichinella nativa TaxID=6335 RepID=A0A0V1LPT0_9BILA|nr:hypothetical protein T06_11198 [Trichinella sp. T6]KRZ61483.1 hypothetical protein T02_4340 [Trichinella nativa]